MFDKYGAIIDGGWEEIKQVKARHDRQTSSKSTTGAAGLPILAALTFSNLSVSLPFLLLGLLQPFHLLDVFPVLPPKV